MSQWDGNTTSIRTTFTPTDEETNNQVRDWLGSKKLLGQVHSTNQRGFGHITVYDGAQVLLDPNSEQIDAWFQNDDLELEVGDWVVFTAQDSPSHVKKSKRRYNPYLMQAQKDSVELVEEISQLRDSLQELKSPFISLQDDYLECLFVFGERLFIAKAYADELQAKVKAHYKQMFEINSKKERARLVKWKSEKQAQFDQDRAILAEERRTFEEESERTRQDIAQELEELEQLEEEYQQTKEDITQKRKELEQLKEESRRTKQDMAKELELLNQLGEESRRTEQDMAKELDQLNNLKEERKDVKQHLAQEWMELEEVEAKRQQMTQNISTTRDELEKLETTRQRIGQDISKKGKELEQINEEYWRTKQDVAGEVEQLNNLKEEHKEVEQHLTQESMELEKVNTKHQEMTQKITKKGDELEKLEAKRQRIEQDMAKEREKIEQERAEIAKTLKELKRQSAAMQREQRDIESKQKLVNESLQRWGFDSINVAESTDELRFNQFDNERKLIEGVEQYIAAQGYYFKRDDIVNFYTCLKTGAMVVLAGLSGTGKSSLVRLFAEAVGAKERFRLVSVKATWNDDSDLRGFYHPEKKSYISTPFLDMIVQANAHPEQLFFVCLDEMNLSRVEYYFSDFLSVLEQDKKERKLPLYSENEWRIRKSQLERQRQALENGKLTQEEFDQLERHVHCYGHEVLIPDNLFICGTVNVDETTYPFSDKVLDRVQIIQFESVEFLDNEMTKDLSVLPVNLTFSQFQEYCHKVSEIPIDNNWFNELNRCLQTGGFHFGYRVKRQIEDYCAYALHSKLFDNLSEDEIVDMQMVQKILPKIRGIKSKRVAHMFDKLGKFCKKYPNASKKISSMDQMDSINYWEVFRYVG